jgi:DNA invertase Pin-like site-specific DNA recombinase
MLCIKIVVMKAVTYSRVSTERDQDPEAQRAELSRYCAARNWQVIEDLVDHGYSGGTDQRPGLKRLLSLVRARQVDCWKRRSSYKPKSPVWRGPWAIQLEYLNT